MADRDTNPGLAAATAATEPARWLLEAGIEGVALTQTHALARAVVREAALRWPGWWNADLFGEPYRETDVRVVGMLREGLQRLELMRRRGRTLRTSPRGRELVKDPLALALVLSSDLGGGDPFEEDVAEAITAGLAQGGPLSDTELTHAAMARIARDGWIGPNGLPPNDRELSAVVWTIICQGEAYGLIRREHEPGGSQITRTQISLTEAGAGVFGETDSAPALGAVLVFDAELVGVRGVRARVAVGAAQHLTALHDVIQEAFCWFDDHLYSFWLNNEFHGGEEFEYTSPEIPDEGCSTADVPIAELGLSVGAKIAYVFDFGDNWRVRLTLREQTDHGSGHYPRVLHLTGTPPPQYCGLDEM